MKNWFTLLLFCYFLACGSNNPTQGVDPDVALPNNNDLVGCTSVTEACSLTDSGVVSNISLPAPVYSLDFESGEEIIKNTSYFSKGISANFPDNPVFELAKGKTGTALKVTEGVVALPFKKIFSSKEGSLALWIKRDAETQDDMGKSVIFFETSHLSSGLNFILWTHPVDHALHFFASEDVSPQVELVSQDILQWGKGEWHHIALTWDLTQESLFVDGRLEDQKPRAADFPQTSNLPDYLFILGSARAPTSGASDGLLGMDSFRAYNQKLTPAQVEGLYLTDLQTQGPSTTVGNLKLQLMGREDGFSFSSLSDSRYDQGKTANPQKRSLWQVDFISANDPKLQSSLTNLSDSEKTCLTNSKTGEILLEWKNTRLPSILDQPSRVDVSVCLTPDKKNELLQAQLKVENSSGTWSVKQVHFPQIRNIKAPQEKPELTRLILPGPNVGSFIDNPFSNPLRVLPSNFDKPATYWDFTNVNYPSRDLPMQWFGLMDIENEGGGLYLASHDGSGTLKSFSLVHAGTVSSPLDFEMIIPATDIGFQGNDYVQQGQAILAIVDGGWYSMARKYRDFALNQLWTKKGRLFDRLQTDLPDWLAHTGFISPTIWETAEILDNLAASEGEFLWHSSRWQKANNYYQGYLSQLNDMPTIEPEDFFIKNWLSASEEKIPVTPYFLPAHWDTLQDFNPQGSLDRESEVIQAALVNDEGACQVTDHFTRSLNNQGEMITEEIELPDCQNPLFSSSRTCLAPRFCKAPEEYLNPKIPSVYMLKLCPQAKLTQEITKKSLLEILNHEGVKGVYLDVLAAGNPLPCFAKNHNHLPGGGFYYVDGFRQILSGVRQEFKAKNGALNAKARLGFTTEGFSEPYMDFIDGFITEAFPENPLPLAMVVYHDYTQFLGRRSNLSGESELAIMARQAQLLLWGGVPGFLLNGDLTAPSTSLVRQFMLTLAHARNLFADYLVYGEMLPTPEVRLNKALVKEADPLLVPWSQGETPPLLSPDIGIPSVLASAFRHPEQKKTGLILGNLDLQKTQAILINPDREKLRIGNGELKVILKMIKNNQETTFELEKSLLPDQSLQISLSPLELVLIEFEAS